MTNERGYTVMEVMAAMAVFIISALGIVSIQKVTVLGNRNAKTLTTANAIGSGWIERLRYDAVYWSAPGTAMLGNTVYLKLVNTGWTLPTGGEAQLLGAPKADVFGVDIFPNDNMTAGYCTHIRLTPVGDPATTDLLRAEVRVLWARDGGPVADNVCNDAANFLMPNPTYGVAMFTTGVQRGQ